MDVSVTHLTLDELNSLVIERDTGDMLWYYLIDHYLDDYYFHELLEYNKDLIGSIGVIETYEVKIERSKVDQLMRLANEIGFDVELKK